MPNGTLCECGCGREAKPGRSYLRGHAGHSAIRERGTWGPRLWNVEDCGYATECWVWIGHKEKGGYGVTRWNGKTVVAHVRAWIESGRERVADMQIDHLCGQRACVNPAHLDQVTPAVNSRRSRATKLTMDKAREIRRRYAAGGISQPQLAREYGISQGNVGFILAGKTWVEA